MKWVGNYFHAESNTATLAFPNFCVDMDTTHEIGAIIHQSNNKPSFDESTATPTPTNKTRKSLRLVSSNVPLFVPNPSPTSVPTTTVQIQLLSPNASIPKCGTPGCAGYDVTTTTKHVIPPNSIAKVPLGFSLAMPPTVYARIAPCSSLSLQHISIEGGVVDSDYRGEVMALIKNNTSSPFTLHPQQKCAQIFFEQHSKPLLELVETLPSTLRGKGVFGSTNTPKSRRSISTDTFCLDSTYILKLNNSNPFRPIARRIRAPISPTHQLDPASHQNMNPITLHDLDPSPTTPTDPILKTAATHTPTTLPNDMPTHPSPRQTPQYTVNKSLPSHITLSQDSLKRSIGFLNPSTLIKHIHQLGNKNVSIQRLPSAESLDPGETSSIHKARKNKTPLQQPSKYGDIFHMDIGYGPETSIGGIKYTLLLIDKYSKYKFVYGLKNLTSSLEDAMKQFLVDCNTTPTLICTDFDSKFLGGKVAQLLRDKEIPVECSPPYRQHQNGLVERHWQTLVQMTQNWLCSSMLPSKYWYFGIKRAVEILNIMPCKVDSKYTTPYELVHGANLTTVYYSQCSVLHTSGKNVTMVQLKTNGQQNP